MWKHKPTNSTAELVAPKKQLFPVLSSQIIFINSNGDISGARQAILNESLSLQNWRSPRPIKGEVITGARHIFDDTHQVNKGMTAIRAFTTSQTCRRRIIFEQGINIQTATGSHGLNDLSRLC